MRLFFLLLALPLFAAGAPLPLVPPRAAATRQVVPMKKVAKFMPASVGSSSVSCAYTCDFNWFHCDSTNDPNCVLYDILRVKTTQTGVALTLVFADSVMQGGEWPWLAQYAACPAQRTVTFEWTFPRDQRVPGRVIRAIETPPGFAPASLAPSELKLNPALYPRPRVWVEDEGNTPLRKKAAKL